MSETVLELLEILWLCGVTGYLISIAHKIRREIGKHGNSDPI